MARARARGYQTCILSYVPTTIVDVRVSLSRRDLHYISRRNETLSLSRSLSEETADSHLICASMHKTRYAYAVTRLRRNVCRSIGDLKNAFFMSENSTELYRERERERELFPERRK